MKLIGLFATVTVISAIMPFYPVKVFALIVAGWMAFCLLAWKLPRLATFFLFVAVPFFGNHPGGRFMELFPMFSFLWLAAVTLRGELRMSRRFLLVYALFLLFLILPFALHPSLFRATSFYKNGLFHLLNANEHSPLYPLQQTIWLAAIPLMALAARSYTRYVIVGITVGFALTLVVGTFEILSPTLAAILDRLHVFLDGYVDRTPPHGIAAGFHPFQWLTHSPNSLFWNRSWHAVFIIASLPFVSLFLHERLKELRISRRRIIIAAALILLTLYLSAVGARGGLLAWSAFLAVSGIGWIFNRSASRLLYALPPVAIVGALLSQIAVPLFIVFTEQGRTEFRYPQFAAAFQIFAMFPLTGGGTESYGYYNNFFLRAGAEAAKHGSSHNQLLQIATGNGLLGIFFYSGLLFGFANETRKRMIAAKQDSIPLVLITAGMTSALVYGSVQEWNYLRPIMLMWTVLLYLPWTYQVEHSSPYPNRWWILSSVCILVLVCTYRPHLPSRFFASHQDSEAMQTGVSEGGNTQITVKDFSEAFTPTVPWLGVEYVDPDRFVIMQGESHILLPPELQIGKITPLREDSDLTFTWSLSQQDRYLRIRCHSDSANIRGDIDARRLCAEITIPESTKYFQSLEDPVLYRERTKQRGLF